MMAGGIDWFRWHHGSVNDPKFRLVAARSGASVAEVIAVWACLLEAASMAEKRGAAGIPDFEATDCALGFHAGKAESIFKAMVAREIISHAGDVSAWEKRQPQREREDRSAADRKRLQRGRASADEVTPSHTDENHVTPCHTTSHQKTPRGEERRGEENNYLERVRTDSREDPGTPTIYGSISREIRHAGVQSNPSHPTFRALVDAGATAAEFLAYVPNALAARGDRFAYLIGCVTSEREKAASLAGRLHLGAMPAVETDYARSMREKYEQLAPSVAARAPGLRAKPIVFDFEVEDVTPRLMG